MVVCSVVDPDQNWIRIQNCFVDPDPYSKYGSGTRQVNICRINHKLPAKGVRVRYNFRTSIHHSETRLFLQAFKKDCLLKKIVLL